MKTLNVVLLVLVALMTVVIGVLLAPIYIFRHEFRTMLLVRLSKRISAWLYPDGSKKKKRSNVSYEKYQSRRSGPYPYNEIHPPYVNTIFKSKHEADQILSSLVDAVIDYGYASVEDLNELKGIDSLYTDKTWGWYTLDGATIERAGSYYRLNLPRPSKINVKDVIEKG